MTRPNGFTLLEVLVALAILATSLTVIMGTIATSSQQAIYANKMTRIAELAKTKMIDLEYKLMEEGFEKQGQEFEGDFRDEGFSNVSWEAVSQPLEIPEDVQKELKAKVNAQLFGGKKSQGALTGNAAFSAMLPQLIGIVPKMINRIGKKVRRLNLIVYYDFAGQRESVQVTQYVVSTSSSSFEVFGGDQQLSGDEAIDLGK